MDWRTLTTFGSEGLHPSSESQNHRWGRDT